MATPTRRRLVVGFLAVAASMSCKGKEPPPTAQPTTPPPSAAPAATLPPTTTTTTTLPPPVWQSVRWGMAKAEVIAAFPGAAQQLAVPVEFAQGTATTDVSIPAYELETVKFRVFFGFDAGALNRIHLSAGKADDATCGLMEKALTDTHGAPAEKETTGTSLRSQQTTWKLPDKTIALACAGRPALGFQSVTIDYAPPGAEGPAATR